MYFSLDTRYFCAKHLTTPGGKEASSCAKPARNSNIFTNLAQPAWRRQAENGDEIAHGGLIRHDPDSEEGDVARVFLRRQEYGKAVAMGGDVSGEGYVLEAMQQVGIHLQSVRVVGVGVPGEADLGPGPCRFDAKRCSIGLTGVCSENVLENVYETILFGVGESPRDRRVGLFRQGKIVFLELFKAGLDPNHERFAVSRRPPGAGALRGQEKPILFPGAVGQVGRKYSG